MPSPAQGPIAVIRYSLDHELTDNSRRAGEQALAGIAPDDGQHPIMGDVRGRGLMFGIEYVRERATKEPFPPQLHVSYRVEKAALDRGLVTYPCTGTVDGALGDMTLMAPPLPITPGQMDDLLAILDQAIGEVERTLAVK